MTNRRISVPERIAAVLFGLAVGLVTAEILARFIADEAPPSRPLTPPSNTGLPELRTVFQLAKPGAEGLYKGVYYRANSLGLREREVSVPASPGVFRVVVLGDSVTMGSGVLAEQAYSRRLEELFNRAAAPGRHFEVINLGLDGLNVAQIADRLEKFGEQLSPDLIIYGFTINDLETASYRGSVDSQVMGDLMRKYVRFARSRSRAVRLAWPRIVAIREIVAPVPGTYIHELRDNYVDNPAVWSEFRAVMQRLSEIGEKLGAPVVVFQHSYLSYLHIFHPFHRYYGMIEAVAREYGMSYVGSFEMLRGRAPASLWVSSTDHHPNAGGHELLAQALYAGLVGLPDVLPAGLLRDSRSTPE